MGPKRKENVHNGAKKDENNVVDHELFLQAFESKNLTSSYRNILTENICLPIIDSGTFLFVQCVHILLGIRNS